MNMIEPPSGGNDERSKHGQLKTLHHALDVFEYLLARGSPASLKEVSQVTGLSKSQMHRILVTLTKRGYIQQDEETRQYRLGINTWLLASAVKSPQMQIEVVRSVLDELSDEVGETAFLSTLHMGSVLYLYTKMSPKPTLAYLQVGNRVPIHATASGKAMLSTKDSAYVKEIIGGGLEKLTKHTASTLERLNAELEETRQRGYAIERDEWSIGLSAIATAIPALKSTDVAAIGLFVLTPSLDGERLHELAGGLMRTREAILERMKKVLS